MSMVNERNIAKVRAYYRLSCEKMGAMMGVSGRFVSHVEQGARNLPNNRAKMLDEKLAMTPQKLREILDTYAETTIVAVRLRIDESQRKDCV